MTNFRALRADSVLLSRMDSPDSSWAREMSRAASGSLVVYDDGKVRESYAPEAARSVTYGLGRQYVPDPVPPGLSSADFSVIAELNPHLGALRVRWDSRVDSVLVMDESTDFGLIVTRKTIEELGGLRPALQVAVNRLLEARLWPAERRVALGGC